MNVGQAARLSGLTTKTIRYYEEIGLLKADRAPNGYRDYTKDDVERLGFVKRARDLGFAIEECRQLMALRLDKGRASQDVRAIAVAHVEAINRKIDELREMRSSLESLIHACHGDEKPECAILDGISMNVAPGRKAVHS